ncbi:MAG: NUDIX hydrolase [Acidimicrobiales bacterium]
MSLGVATFTGPDGTSFQRDVVHHPEAVSAVPLLDDGTVVLVRQYRAPLERELLEIPAGIRDVDGEDPETTAGRELVEEVGLRAGRLERLAVFCTTRPGAPTRRCRCSWPPTSRPSRTTARAWRSST